MDTEKYIQPDKHKKERQARDFGWGWGLLWVIVGYVAYFVITRIFH